MNYMIKINNNNKLLYKFNVLSKYLNYTKNISFNKFKNIVLEIFGNNWINDIEDIAYFYHYMEYINIIKKQNGTINTIILNTKINTYKNFNKEITEYFNFDEIKNILYKW